MKPTILLAGATGSIGSELLPRLRRNGYWVRALCRRPAVAARIASLAHDVVVADATRLSEIHRVTESIDIVVSCLGGNVGLTLRERRSYEEVDTTANENLLYLALETGVRRFVYLSVFVTPSYAETRYVRAHERFVEQLHAAGIDATVIRPTGLFTSLDPIAKMAKRGPVPVISNGAARTNPVDPADVADLCMTYLESGPPEAPIGGPEGLTRRDIAACAFASLGKSARIVSVPPWIFHASSSLVRWVHPRLSELLEFMVQVSTSDALAPAIGKRTLREYFVGPRRRERPRAPAALKPAVRGNGASS